MVREKCDNKSLRIFRLLSLKGYLSEDQVRGLFVVAISVLECFDDNFFDSENVFDKLK